MPRTRAEILAEREKLDAEIAALGEEAAEKKDEAQEQHVKAAHARRVGDFQAAERHEHIARMSEDSAATLMDLLRKDIALREGKSPPPDEPEQKHKTILEKLFGDD